MKTPILDRYVTGDKTILLQWMQGLLGSEPIELDPLDPVDHEIVYFLNREGGYQQTAWDQASGASLDGVGEDTYEWRDIWRYAETYDNGIRFIWTRRFPVDRRHVRAGVWIALSELKRCIDLIGDTNLVSDILLKEF